MSGTAPPLLRLDGYEGPLDLLLDLARSQKVDLSRISILRLVEQYLAAVDGVRLELAADWLVMAAWLAWLKSRLLLPDDPQAAEEGDRASALLHTRLEELERIGRAAAWLDSRPVLGRNVFARGAGECLVEIDRSGLLLDLNGLLAGYLACCRRGARRAVYRPRPVAFWTVREALDRLGRLLGERPAGWHALAGFLPGSPAHATTTQRRAALAGTLVAGLELARGGAVELRQDQPFGPVLLRRPAPDAGAPGRAAG